jgi:hypothetical protein
LFQQTRCTLPAHTFAAAVPPAADNATGWTGGRRSGWTGRTDRAIVSRAGLSCPTSGTDSCTSNVPGAVDGLAEGKGKGSRDCSVLLLNLEPQGCGQGLPRCLPATHARLCAGAKARVGSLAVQQRRERPVMDMRPTWEAGTKTCCGAWPWGGTAGRKSGRRRRHRTDAQDQAVEAQIFPLVEGYRIDVRESSCLCPVPGV